MSTNVIIVFIAGPSGSGKSSLSRNVSQKLSPQHRVEILSEDAYYRQQTHLSLRDRENTNYDHPDAIEESLLLEHLERIKAGHAVETPIYDYRIHDRSSETRLIVPPDVLIVEGILLLHRHAIQHLSSLSVFVDVPEDICFQRRLQRDTRERDRSHQSVVEQYEQSVRPMYRRYVKPSIRNADLVVSVGGEDESSIAEVVLRVSQL